jgi:Rhodopirellula transposase DDE domain
LVSHEVIVNLIKATKTAQGLRVETEIDHTIYPAGHGAKNNCTKFSHLFGVVLRTTK